VLCKVGKLSLNKDGVSIDVQNIEKLAKTTASISHFLLEFFVSSTVMRPLTNSNFVCDFHRYRGSPYYVTVTKYLKVHLQQQDVPAYAEQYNIIMQYFHDTKLLHKYERFILDGAMASTPNTKSLQLVTSTEVNKLARGDYYKYRAANLMFGFNAGIMQGLECFCDFNALRKNQLLRFYEATTLKGCAAALARSELTTKFRDYCKSDIFSFTYVSEY
jgi:hypothetical protein